MDFTAWIFLHAVHVFILNHPVFAHGILSLQCRLYTLGGSIVWPNWPGGSQIDKTLRLIPIKASVK